MCLQGIISIVYIVGVNPMAQSSSNIIYNPMLMMCQSLYQSGYNQAGGVGGFGLYNQYIYHYCFVDPQEVGSLFSASLNDLHFHGYSPVPAFSQGIAMACGFLVVIALGVAAFFAQKTRGKIWRHGKPNIYWAEPLVGGKASEGRDVEEWVREAFMRPGLRGDLRRKIRFQPNLTLNWCRHSLHSNKQQQSLNPPRFD